MAVRTTTTAVETVLGRNYDGSTPLKQFVDMANLFVARVVACASARGTSLDTTSAEMIERLMAAHFYCSTVDPLYSSKSTDGASGSFIRDQEIGDYAKQATMIDPTGGCVRRVLSGRQVNVTWGGKAPSERTPYEQRD